MDSKNIKDGRLADLALRTQLICAAVKDIPGASIDSANVVIDLSLFGDNASVVLARVGDEIASVSVSGTDATLDFTTDATSASILELFVKQDL